MPHGKRMHDAVDARDEMMSVCKPRRESLGPAPMDEKQRK